MSATTTSSNPDGSELRAPQVIAADTASTVDWAAVVRKIDGGAMNLRDEVAALERIALDEAQRTRQHRRAGGSPARASRTRRFAHSRRHLGWDDAPAR